VNQADTRAPDTAERHVTALYQAHALSLARLALLMLGDRGAAEDVVQDCTAAGASWPAPMPRSATCAPAC
jgi:DNA-directed RNA polymerase specialized sigma24 family protein